MTSSGGRPSRFSEETAGKLCDWLVQGGSLRGFCARAGNPSTTTVLRWLEKHEAFRGQYARARELQAELIFEEILEIADDPRYDWVERTTENGRTVVVADHEHIQRSRLRVDARKWVLARMAPRKYSERAQLALSGAIAGPVEFSWGDPVNVAEIVKKASAEWEAEAKDNGKAALGVRWGGSEPAESLDQTG